MIQIVEKPYLFPQKCFFTGDGNERPILDTGKEDPELGRVYISLSYMDELATAAGYVTLADAAKLREENAALKARLDLIPEALERAEADVRLAHDRAVVALRGWDGDDALLGAPGAPADAD